MQDFITLRAAVKAHNDDPDNPDKPYWIGLRHTGDPTDTDSYSWSDDTPFDFGTNFSKGVAPWSPNNPNSPLQDGCIRLNNKQNFTWDDVPCNNETGIVDGQKSRPICVNISASDNDDDTTPTPTTPPITTGSPTSSPTVKPTNPPTGTPSVSPTPTPRTTEDEQDEGKVGNDTQIDSEDSNINEQQNLPDPDKNLMMTVIICACAAVTCCVIIIGGCLVKRSLDKQKQNAGPGYSPGSRQPNKHKRISRDYTITLESERGSSKRSMGDERDEGGDHALPATNTDKADADDTGEDDVEDEDGSHERKRLKKVTITAGGGEEIVDLEQDEFVIDDDDEDDELVIFEQASGRKRDRVFIDDDEEDLEGGDRDGSHGNDAENGTLEGMDNEEDVDLSAIDGRHSGVTSK